jgi:hypothetical protein
MADEESGGAVEVGTAYVSIIPSARGFAKKLRAELEREIKTLDLDKVIGDQIGKRPIKIPVVADFDSNGLKGKVDEAARRAKTKVKVDVDTDKSSLGGAFKGIASLLPNIGGIASKVQDLVGSLQEAAGSSAKLGGNLAGSVETATGPIGAAIGLVAALGAGLAAVGGAAIFAAPALSAVAGAIASLPAVAVGGGAALATLALGLRGIAAAFKPAARGGGGGGGEDAATRARRIAGAERGIDAARRGIASATRGVAAAEQGLVDAERGLATAQDRSAKAQLAVNKARAEAAEDLQQLNFQLRDAQISEVEAAQAVQDAQRDLEEAKVGGDIPTITRANNALERAQLTLDEASDSAKDLTKSQAAQSKAGVEGSDKVKDALAEQADAMQGVRDAQQGILDAQNGILSANESLQSSYDGLASANDALAEAQKKNAGAGGAAAAAVVKLAPAAQKFVDAVKALGPAFDRLRLDVQQRLFEGLDKTVTNLGNAWIPQLRITLGGYADTFNGFFKTLGSTLTQPKVITDLAAGAGVRALWAGEAGPGHRGPAGEGLRDAVRRGGPVRHRAVQQARRHRHEVLRVGRGGPQVGCAAGVLQERGEGAAETSSTSAARSRRSSALITIIVGKPLTSGSKTPLEQFRDGLQKIANYLNDPSNQQKIRDFLGDIEKVVSGLLTVAGKVSSIYDKIRNALGGDGSGLGADIGSAIISGLVLGLETNAKLATDAFFGSFQFLINGVKKLLGIKSPSTVFAEIGRNIIDGLTGGIGAKLGSLSAQISGIPSRIRSAIGRAGDVLYTVGQNIAIGLANGIGNLLGTVSKYAGYARSAVTGAFSGAGKLLYNVGKNIVIGLINGISSMLSSLGNFLGSIGTFIQDHKGPIEKDRKLLVGAGQAIMGGLITGIASQRAALGDELGVVTDMFGNVVPQLTANPTSGVRAGGSAGAPSALLTVDASATSDPLLRALADVIRLRYNGDPMAALGG